ncbi:MAG: cation diffusion facilitator family transporter [Pseudomonadota bacterium]
MKYYKCEQCENRVVAISLCTNVILAAAKIFVGVAGGSKACIADGLHSTVNTITLLAIVVSRKITKKEATSEFPYGYGKVEFVLAWFVSMLITGGAIVLMIEAVKHLVHEPIEPPHSSVMLMSLISIVANEMIFRYMRCVGLRAKSQTIMASALASRANSFSSLAVFFGVAGAMLGFHHLDPMTALVVVVVIISMSGKILLQSSKALMDSSVNHAYREQIEDIVRGIEQVQGIGDLKTRHVGQKIWAELEIQVLPHCTLGQGQLIAGQVRQTLLKNVTDLEKVLVHLGPVRD